jgi:NADH dehydrogenase (ubiquinone) 1 beta subcomplex subunit 7
MSDARLPLAYRDTCAHLLIPLNRCRHNEYYLPWKCEVRLLPTFSDPQTSKLPPFDLLLQNNLLTQTPSKQNERHSYEKCQYEEFKKRVAKMDELRAAKGGERSN